MALGDVVDKFLDEHGLADSSAAEQADLAALGVGCEQIDDLDPGDEDRGSRSTGRRTSGASAWIGIDISVWPIGPRSSIGSPMTFMIRPSVLRTDGDADLAEPSVGDFAGRGSGPSVASIAMVRTIFSPRCWATSSTRRLPPLFEVSSAARIGWQAIAARTSTSDDRADNLR